MFTILNATAFVGTTVIQTQLSFAGLLEYLIFFALIIGGVALIKKTNKHFIKTCGYIMASVGIGCLGWMIGWQIYIRMFLL